VRRGFGRGRHGPGLLGTMARTAVVAGTASAVAGRAGQTQAASAAHAQARMQAEVETQVADALRAEAAAGPAAPAVDVLYAQLTKLGELRETGLLSEAEFAQQKARLLR
jgi:Short C-terminal domain